MEIGVRKGEASENPKSGSHPSGAAMVLKPVNGENSLFGYSYSANSDSVLVGAPLHSGGTGSLFECSFETEQCTPIISNDVASGSEHFFQLFLV